MKISDILDKLEPNFKSKLRLAQTQLLKPELLFLRKTKIVTAKFKFSMFPTSFT